MSWNYRWVVKDLKAFRLKNFLIKSNRKLQSDILPKLTIPSESIRPTKQPIIPLPLQPLSVNVQTHSSILNIKLR